MKPGQNKTLWDQSWFSSFYLLLLVGAAAGGLVSGLSPEMMIAGAALVLISWELLEQLVRQRANNIVSVPNSGKQEHFRYLIMSVGSGLFIAEGGLLIQLSLPFGIVVLAVLIILYSLNRFYRLCIC